MGPGSILVKTDKGAEEISTRKYKLDAKLRTLLIMVNGNASVADLQQKFAGMDIAPQLAQLAKDGFVREGSSQGTASPAPAPAGASSGDIRKVRIEVARALTDILGPSAEAMAVKIEECETMGALRAYLDARKAMLTSAMGRRAPDFWAKVDSLTRA
jgi:hypothetical protein